MLDALRRFLDDTKSLNVVVIGDLMLDEWVHTDINRVSPEAPVMVAKVKGIQRTVGGAGNVAWNATRIGCNEVFLYGVIGSDKEGSHVLSIAKEIGANTEAIVKQSSRPTTKKTRIICQGQQVLRIDNEMTSPMNLKSTFLKYLGKHFDQCINGILISDYDKGVITHPLFHSVQSFAKEAAIPIYVNAKPHNIYFLEEVRMITMNEKEVKEAFGPGETDEKGKRSDIFVTTLGDRGMEVLTPNESFVVPTHKVEVADVVGAGDTAFTVLALCDMMGINMREAAAIANLAAALVVSKHGVAPVSREELEEYVFSQ